MNLSWFRGALFDFYFRTNAFFESRGIFYFSVRAEFLVWPIFPRTKIPVLPVQFFPFQNLMSTLHMLNCVGINEEDWVRQRIT